MMRRNLIALLFVLGLVAPAVNGATQSQQTTETTTTETRASKEKADSSSEIDDDEDRDLESVQATQTERIEEETEEVSADTDASNEKDTSTLSDTTETSTVRSPRQEVIELEEGEELRTVDPNKQVAVVKTSERDSLIPPLRWGFQVGGNISNPKRVGDDNRNAEGGLWGGAIVESNFIGRYIALQSELNYVQRPVQLGPNSLRLDYLEMPLHAKLKLNIASVQAFVQAGPSLGYLIHTENAGTRQFDNFDVNFDVGAGLSLFTSRDRLNQLFIAARYSTGIQSVDDGVDNWKAEGVRLSVGMIL